MENEAGVRLIVIEQQGNSIWRGKHRSLHDAIQAGQAGIGVDRVLLTRATLYEVTVVMVVIEEQRRIYLTPLPDFFDEELTKTRANYQGRATRIVPYERFHAKYLGPSLRKRKRVAKTA